MKPNSPERRRYDRYQMDKSPVVFCSTLIGKIADVSLGGMKMVHTGRPAKFLGDLCKISILGIDSAMEFQAQLVGSTKVNKLVNLCRFKFVSLTKEKQSELRQFIDKNTSLNLSHQP